MKKKKVIIIEIIIFLIFNVIAFVIPSHYSNSFWIVYIFSIISFVINGFIWATFFVHNPSIKSKFYKISILYISVIYACVQVLLFIIFKFVHCSAWIPLVLCFMLLAWALIGFIAIS